MARAAERAFSSQVTVGAAPGGVLGAGLFGGVDLGAAQALGEGVLLGGQGAVLGGLAVEGAASRRAYS